MNELRDQELEAFEAELRKIKPTSAPNALVSRLSAVRPTSRPEVVDRVESAPRGYAWVRFMRWLAPATALGVLLVITLGRQYRPNAVRTDTDSEQAKASSVPISSRIRPAKADEIEIGRTLVATFDAVAELPSGEPVRFRCQQWADTTIFRDRARGIAVERSTPRLEIVPVSLDTY
jgi:hypothetical protein